MFPERFSNLPAYAFPRLRALLDHHDPGGPVLHMSIGEPKHPFPAWISEIIARHVADFGRYPSNEGTAELRAAISDWLNRRYGVTMDPATQVMNLNGTREGLYNIGMALCPEQKRGQRPAVLMPNPFYQVYMISAISVGAEPVFTPATAETGHLPDYAGLPAEVLDRTALCYICSPANPQGVMADEAYWRELIGLAEKHDFQIVADECYAELYRDTPPTGALEVAAAMGAHPERVLSLHSLSKRSNLPGLRSGFVAGGPEGIARLRQLRAYSGAPVPLPLQHVSEALWTDEAHVRENRALWAQKYALADEILGNVPGYMSPQAGMFVWLPVKDGEAATFKLWTETGVRVLPGAYLSRDTADGNPGQGYIRAALVAPQDETRDGLTRIRDCLFT
ncbi:aminotransferase class I/II-fold pyridoxal phosphate-dependent enzyme [Mameliella alba]|uniref:aminotransferase class I/II-fold pyridoxal phosphate-dependent enzyme n=1 Tax=Mameliella alba TaxID=561184 RepID=UPI000B534F5F|nr:aminotransferase class I/II-fold pyridoxal phosphate-dependent enzyme [Mameliella alba]MBY6117998.1 aminotransferase class I/II-fold pyridoxal phosphate-dependent enzyme [Mameliella alba]OWV44260.1 aspartate aminotransferase [Mameliella alba]OWV63891.1 aspartate aminotransferase [Mameliella alba]